MRHFIAFSRVLAWILVIGGLLIGLLRLTVLRWIRIPADDAVLGTSIIPTLAAGDLVLLARGPRPTFGDLVLCPEPGYPERFVIGRIVGESGDDVRLTNGNVLVNGKRFSSERGCDPATVTFPHPDRPFEEVTQSCEWEVIANHLHKAATTGGHTPRVFDQSYQVPEGQWFLISDNRLFPYDSRDYGFVDKSTCKEMVVFRLTSLQGWRDNKNRLTFIQ